MIKNHNYEYLVNGPIFTVLIRMTAPMLAAILLLFAYDLLESRLLSQIGLQSLTALGFTIPVTTGMMAFAIAVTIATNTIVTQTLSQQHHRTGNVIVNALLLGLLLSTVLSVLAYQFSQPIFELLGINYALLPDSFHLGPRPQLMPLIDHYMTWRYLGWPFLVLIWQVNSLLRSVGLVKPASILFVAWMSAKITLALVLFAHPQWLALSALETAGLVHLIADSVFALISLFWLIQQLKITAWRDILNAPLTTLRQMAKIGIPATMQQLLTPISITLLTVIVVEHGQIYVAALGIFFRLEALFLLVPMVITTSLPSIIGINWWSGHYQRVRLLLSQAKILVVVSQVISAILLWFTAATLANWFNPDPQLQQYLQQYLHIVPLSYIGAGICIICQSSFNATGHFILASVLGFSHRIVLMLSCCYIGIQWFGMVGLFYGILTAHLLAALLAIFINRRIHHMIGDQGAA